MAKGVISGLFWGALVSVLALAFLSLYSGLPPRTAGTPTSSDLGVPAGSEFNRNRADTRPVIPQAEDIETPAPTSTVAPPTSESAPAPDTSSAAAPTSATGVPATPQTPGIETGALPSAGTGDGSGSGLGSRPTLGSPDVTVESVPSAPAMPVIRKSGEIVQEEPARTTVALATPLPVPSQPQTPSLPETSSIEVAPASEPQTSVVEPEASEPETARVIELPSITQPDAEEPGPEAIEVVTAEPETDTPASEETAATEPAATLGALARNSAPFDATASDLPLFSVVLIDAGAQGLGRAAIEAMSFPVTIALDPTAPGASSAADTYRKAGHEVLILPPQSGSADLGETLADYLEQLPQAIGVVDARTNGFGSNSRQVERVVEILGPGKHGLLTYDKGLNTAQQIAEREGISSALIFRMLDADHENQTTIKRYLDRAAFKSAQEGHVIMIGHSYAETVTALFSWMLEPRSETVRMAPLSAIMRQ